MFTVGVFLLFCSALHVIIHKSVINCIVEQLMLLTVVQLIIIIIAVTMSVVLSP